MSTGLVIALIVGAALLGIVALAFGSGGGADPLSFTPQGVTSPKGGGGLLGGLIGGLF